VKLNLLPKIVDTTGRAKRAFFGGLLVLIASIVGAYMMQSISAKRLDTAKESEQKAQPMYDKAVATAGEADTMMSKPAVRQLVVNTALAKAMKGANRLYPDLYDYVRPYIPGFFRITTLSASPIDASTCTVNMTGTVKNAQQYADLMLALLRIPGATGVTRGGFQAEDVVVPSLTLVDQKGKPRLESKAPIPDDPLERLAYFQNETSPTGYLNAGNFGDTNDAVIKGARPGESLINVSVTIPKGIQTPNPQATIKGLAGGAATTPAPVTPAANPTTPPPAAAGGKGKAGKGSPSDE
jgi:hypothetical protein